VLQDIRDKYELGKVLGSGSFGQAVKHTKTLNRRRFLEAKRSWSFLGKGTKNWVNAGDGNHAKYKAGT